MEAGLEGEKLLGKAKMHLMNLMNLKNNKNMRTRRHERSQITSRDGKQAQTG